MSNNRVIRASKDNLTVPRSERFASRLLARVPLLGAAVLAIGSAVAGAAASADAATFGWAEISSSGQIISESKIPAVHVIGNGRYELYTSFNVNQCALTGTINTSAPTDPGPGSASILVGATSATTLFVRTATPSATGSATVDSSRPFSIWIACH